MHVCFSITVVVAIFDIRSVLPMCTHTLSCYNLDSIFDIGWICIGCFSMTVVVAIFDIR